MEFVDFDIVEGYSQTSVTAARLVASLRNKRLEGITIQSLMESCERNNVAIILIGDTLTVVGRMFWAC